MSKCQQCKKGASRNRILTDGVCSDCNTPIQVDYANAPCSIDGKVGDVKFKDFVEWIGNVFMKCVQESLSVKIAECCKEIDSLKDEVKKLRGDLKSSNKEIDKLKDDVKAIKEEREKEKKTVSDNCRYLINHDRSVRQRNVLMFGIPDNDSITLFEEGVDSDQQAAKIILEKIGLNDINILEAFRLGKKNEGDPSTMEDGRPVCRPLKVCLGSSITARSVIAESHKLKNLLDGTGLNIYIKPDKTKAEREEYTRLGKKKTELLLRHPTNEGEDPRVVLKGGKLLVDNVEVDSYKTPQSLF